MYHDTVDIFFFSHLYIISLFFVVFADLTVIQENLFVLTKSRTANHDIVRCDEKNSGHQRDSLNWIEFLTSLFFGSKAPHTIQKKLLHALHILFHLELLSIAFCCDVYSVIFCVQINW